VRSSALTTWSDIYKPSLDHRKITITIDKIDRYRRIPTLRPIKISSISEPTQRARISRIYGPVDIIFRHERYRDRIVIETDSRVEADGPPPNSAT
jgi:hypothetical protein